MAEKEIILNTGFEKNVFVNCPFDKDFIPLLKALLFTIIYCDYNPRIASERLDSGEFRLDKIKELIESSKLSIHDLSRVKTTGKEEIEYFRLNMPFEIGLDFGCRIYHPDPKYRHKRSLIIESEKYSYKKALSDLSNSDVKCHCNEPEEIIYEVRNWFKEINSKDIPGSSIIWDDYNFFLLSLYESIIEKGLKQKDIDRMPTSELIDNMRKWISKEATKS
jgi:hypothetical protein